MVERVDVIVLGMGVGGEEAGNALAEKGLKVVGIESNLVGGECPYYGCIPTKMMVRADDMLAEGRRIPGFAGDSVVKPDWKPVARRIRDADPFDREEPLDRILARVELALIRQRLQQTPTKSAAARSLGITREGLYAKMRRLGMNGEV